MHRALDTHIRRPRPELSEIVERLGALVSPPKSPDVVAGRPNRRRRMT
jgi:hypothetical protein